MVNLDPINAKFAAAIDALPAPHQLGGPNKAFESLEELQRHEPANDVVTQSIEVGGKYGPTSVTLFRPKALVHKPLPMIFYTHGGGWVMGRTFPFPFEQSYEVLEYMIRHGKQYNLLVKTIALAGDSVGGHMAIAMMQMSLQRQLPATIGQIVLWAPVTVTHKKYPSYTTFKDGPFLPEATMDWMIETFIPNKSDRETALGSPLTHLPDDVVSKFPPTIIFLSAVDPLVDEGVAFGQRLQGLGVDASVIKAEGQMHAFCLVKALRNGPTAQAVLELAALKLQRSLSLLQEYRPIVKAFLSERIGMETPPTPTMVRSMRFRDLQVPTPGFGAMGISFALGNDLSYDEAEPVLLEALEQGCTFWDTAVSYGPGKNEKILGDFIRKHNCRDKIFIASKCGIAAFEDGSVTNSAEHITTYIEGTIERLGFTPDLYYIHRMDPSQQPSSRIDAVQAEYSAFETIHETDGLIDTARELDIEFIAYGPLGHGWLVENFPYQTPEDFAPEDYRRQIPKWQGENFYANKRIADGFRELAKRKKWHDFNPGHDEAGAFGRELCVEGYRAYGGGDQGYEEVG
ncbi:NADP-dependent oxidoreductase domain-containing protein [Fusarium oxysporum]|nr:NADP-dependent oxidoreductase domain-containing protein [Fusarium oxysporum]